VASEEPKNHEILIRLADEGVEVIVVRMAAAGILAVKKRAGRPKDLAAIACIESTIDETERECG
jgi:hypothetical protein